ncbi:MAG: hypothetical protein CMH83_08695 [Nocardioides sp.]|nr:hypothetical protein [Nocardioides sp.]
MSKAHRFAVHHPCRSGLVPSSIWAVVRVSPISREGCRPELRYGAWLTLGFLLIQAVWILVVPPFRGADEFDHAYRAAAVARGEWVASDPVADGRGVLVTVPQDIVDAATAQCSSLPYTGPDNCTPAAEEGDGLVRVGSGAGTYYPGFYFLVGTVARPFDGAVALYVMRLATAVLASILLLGAATAACRTRSRWPRVGLILAVTPMVTYSSSIVAPNGVEMCAALAVWCALLALARSEADADRAVLICTLAASAGVLVSLRLLGPVFLVMICLTAVAFDGNRLVGAVRRHPVRASLALLIVGAAGATFMWWIRGPARVSVPRDPPGSHSINWIAQLFVWPLQSIGAYPFPDQPAPATTYAVYALAALAFFVGALLFATRRQKFVLASSLLVAMLLPVAATATTVAERGLIWQGRYGLPFSVGFIVISAQILAGRTSERIEARAAVVAVVGMAVGSLFSLVSVLRAEERRAPSIQDPFWHAPSGALVLALVILSAAAFGMALRSCRLVPGMSNPATRVERSR